MGQLEHPRTETAGVGVVRSSAIEESLTGNQRQYLAGPLGRPQDLEHLPYGDVEVGMSSYPVDTADQPHLHPQQREYQYILNGCALLLNLDTGQIHVLRTGDFYVVEPGVAHAQKQEAGTRILFFKHPAGNDKVLIDPDAELTGWLENLDFHAQTPKSSAVASPQENQ
ncbi:cupin domain-containing protein [Paeniglutamicibacter antarcticus]|uniref:Cupin domain-containing protein n=1 Tax=Arthrobacter terrae TaxID=2935737 RepID=A0A931G785_9MICC|nr:cupin domain-containing protein [Arthrobacter terrae]MBG0739019.1 cupin domain-containing protein [Arthrobacter terrae]